MKKGYSGGKQVDDLITVIIPVYNVETYLRKCIDSVVNQTYKNLQIIIVDDGSTDLSGAICDEYAKKDNRIVVIHKDNGGLSSARNAGMEIAKGQYISFIDSDDWIELTFYEEMMDFIDKYSVDIVMCGAKVIKDSAYIEDRFIYFKNDCVIEHDAALEMILKDEIGSQVWCKLSKTKLWDNIKFPEKRLFEDIPAAYKTFARCTTDIGFIAKPMYYYVLHGDSISFKKNPLKSYHIYLGFKERLEYVKMHFIKCYEYCLILACDCGLSAYCEYCLNNCDEPCPFINDIDSFLFEHKKEILKSPLLSFKRKILFKSYFINKEIFKLMLLTKQKINIALKLIRLKELTIKVGKYKREKTRTEKSAINMSVSGISKVLMIIVGFIARGVFIRCLSIEYLGINGLFSNILTLLSFAELGIGNAIIFSMYKPLKYNDIPLIKSLMALYKNAYNIIAAAVGISGILFIPFLKYLIKDPPVIKENLTAIYLLYLLNTIITYLFTYKKSILTADQRDYIVSIWQNIFYIIQQIIQVIVLIFNHNFIKYLCIQVICSLLNNLVISKIANKIYPYITEKNIDKLPDDEKKLIFKNIRALAVSKVSGVVMNGTDNVIISKILGLVSVGLASNYTLIINSVNDVIWSALSGITASVGNMNAGENSDHKKEVFDQVYLISYWIYSFICVCLLILLTPFIKIWLEDKYIVDSLTVFGLVWIIYTSGVNFPAYTFRTTMGFFDQVKYIYIASAAVNVILSIIMGRCLGMAGVFLATSISRLCTIEIADGIYVYRDGLGISPNFYFKKYCLTFLLFLINYFCSKAAVSLISIDGIIGFIFKCITCIFISNFILIICFFKTKTFNDVIQRLRVVLKK